MKFTVVCVILSNKATDKKRQRRRCLFLFINALQKNPSLLGAECQGVGTTPLHANECGQTEGLYP